MLVLEFKQRLMIHFSSNAERYTEICFLTRAASGVFRQSTTAPYVAIVSYAYWLSKNAPLYLLF